MTTAMTSLDTIVPGTFAAAFFGSCPNCPRPVRAGQLARFIAGGRVAHAACDTPAPRTPGADECPWCHQTMPPTGPCCT